MLRQSPEDDGRGRAASPNGISHANHDGERKMVMIFDHNDEEEDNVCMCVSVKDTKTNDDLIEVISPLR